MYKLNIMSILKQFIPFISNTQGILIHFGSCVENLLDLDEGKLHNYDIKFIYLNWIELK